MDRVLRPHAEYAAAYLDDIVIYSDAWLQHMQQVGVRAAVAEASGAHGQPEEVCDRAEEDPVTGVPPGQGEGPAAGQ